MERYLHSSHRNALGVKAKFSVGRPTLRLAVWSADHRAKVLSHMQATPPDQMLKANQSKGPNNQKRYRTHESECCSHCMNDLSLIPMCCTCDVPGVRLPPVPVFELIGM